MFVISSAVHFSIFLQGFGVTLRTLFESRSAPPLLVIFRGSKSYCRMAEWWMRRKSNAQLQKSQLLTTGDVKEFIHFHG